VAAPLSRASAKPLRARLFRFVRRVNTTCSGPTPNRNPSCWRPATAAAAATRPCSWLAGLAKVLHTSRAAIAATTAGSQGVVAW